MILNTERLAISSLDIEELFLLMNDKKEFENRIGMTCDYYPIGKKLESVLESQIEMVQNHKKDYLLHTIWTINIINENRIIGIICFKNKNEFLEIGYGIGYKFHNNGYMTEALKSICDWAIKEKNVSSIIANTFKSNLISQRVLEKCDFKKMDESQIILTWKFEKTEKQ